jgi:hypothetical protein
MSCADVPRDALLPGAIRMMDRPARQLPYIETRIFEVYVDNPQWEATALIMTCLVQAQRNFNPLWVLWVILDIFCT